MKRTFFGGPLLVIAAVVLGPIIVALFYSFINIHGFSPTGSFVGFTHYKGILSDHSFWISVNNGVKYAGYSTIFQLLLGVSAAFFVDRLTTEGGTRRFINTCLLIPYLIPSVVAVLIFTFMLHGSIGFINHFLKIVGLGSPNWFRGPWIMWTLIGISVWQFFPFVFLPTFARLQVIPEQRYDICSLDGAGFFQKFRYVALPQLKGVLLAVGALRIIIMLMKFDLPWLLASSKGSGRGVDTPAVYAYRQMFEQLDVAEGLAVAILYVLVLTSLLLAVTVYFRSDHQSAGEIL